MTEFIVAVDGPAGSGKSSVSKAVAHELGFAFLDSGASYRALTWWLLQRFGTDVYAQLSDEDIMSAMTDFEYEIGTDPTGYRVHAAGGMVPRTDVSELIRSHEVAEAVSRVARVPKIREWMVNLYRRIIADVTDAGIVVEGRDITTVVAPDADVRVLLTARPEVRAARRAGETDGDQDRVRAAIEARDASDSKSVEFMIPADGVTLLDTSDLNFTESVAALMNLVQKRLAELNDEPTNSDHSA